jgi:hypothetical protein
MDLRVSSASGGLPNLLRYETFAVADYGCMSHALHLRQTQQSLNLGQSVSGKQDVTKKNHNHFHEREQDAFHHYFSCSFFG